MEKERKLTDEGCEVGSLASVALSASAFEYIAKSRLELLALLNQKIIDEKYEDCILIRDELARR